MSGRRITRFTLKTMTVGLFVIISYEKAISESHAKGALMKCSSADEFQESHEITTLLGGGGGEEVTSLGYDLSS